MNRITPTPNCQMEGEMRLQGYESRHRLLGPMPDQCRSELERMRGDGPMIADYLLQWVDGRELRGTMATMKGDVAKISMTGWAIAAAEVVAYRSDVPSGSCREPVDEMRLALCDVAHLPSVQSQIEWLTKEGAFVPPCLHAGLASSVEAIPHTEHSPDVIRHQALCRHLRVAVLR